VQEEKKEKKHRVTDDNPKHVTRCGRVSTTNSNKQNKRGYGGDEYFAELKTIQQMKK